MENIEDGDIEVSDAKLTPNNLSDQPVPAVPDEHASASVRCLAPHTVLTKTPIPATLTITSGTPSGSITYTYDEHNDSTSPRLQLTPPTVTYY